MSRIKFTATKLVGSGKQGILKPDSDGYYEMVIGGLNVHNSAGEYYTLDGAKDLFQSSSILMKRISGGYLKGELGHPKKLHGMSDNDYVDRVHQIEETNTVVHFKSMWLDESYGRNNPNCNNPALVAIMAKLKPAGAKPEVLQKALENPDENVAFSVRGITDDYYQGGKILRVLRTIITFDYVEAPGIHVANKFDSPSVESLSDIIITPKIVSSIQNNVDNNLVATEDTKGLLLDTIQVFNNTKSPVAFKKW